MANIAIIGGHGHIALLLARQLSERGDEVSSIIRKPEQSDDVSETGATPVIADVASLDVDGIAELLDGHDAVVWSAGAGGGTPEQTFAIDRDAATRSMQAAGKVGVSRYVIVSWSGSRRDHGFAEDDSFYPYAEAKAEADEFLRGTSLDWTIVAPSTLTHDSASGRIAVGVEDQDVSREDVAAVVAQVLVDASTVGKTIRFSSGDTAIAEALGSVTSRD